jgi:hypothetical protein
MRRHQLMSHSGTCVVRADYDAVDQCQVRRCLRFPVTFSPSQRVARVLLRVGGRRSLYYRTLPPLKSSRQCSPHHPPVVVV